MNESKPSIWTKPLVSEASDKKIRRGLDWFAFIIGVACSVLFPVLFVLNLRSYRVDYAFVLPFIASLSLAWQMKKKLWPIPEGSVERSRHRTLDEQARHE